MPEVEPLWAIRPALAAWSDRMQNSAANLADKFRDLLGRQIGNAQLSGLNNIVQSAPSVDDIRKFVTHQGQKAERAERNDVKKYWDDLTDALSGLEADVWKLAAEANLPLPPPKSKPKAKRKTLGWLYIAMTREYIQHFVAHSLMIARR